MSALIPSAGRDAGRRLTSRADRRQPVAVGDVSVHDPFWSPRLERLRTTTLHQQHDQLVETGRIAALRLDWIPGSDAPPPDFGGESDVAKWVEAASYLLAVAPDADLEREVDDAIAALAGAQQPDGYLNASITVTDPAARFDDLRGAHELYNAGHLVEAGVAHATATGKTTLLDVARRYADLLVRTFGVGGPLHGAYCGHEEIELALVRLWRATGERSYLELASTFVDARGTSPRWFEVERRRRGAPGMFENLFPDVPERWEQNAEYNQSHRPVREQDEAVGHAVRAMYLYSAMTDLAAETDDDGLWRACRRLWEHLTTRRMYVTGGIGDSAHNEGFTRDWSLPNQTSYAETCAAIGLVMWARRMATTSGEAAYLEVMERALYNGSLAGVSADGRRYFYVNPLASDGDQERRDWFGVPCCPPNLARLHASLGSYAYSASDTEIAVDLFLGSTLRRRVAGVDVELVQRVTSPAGGEVSVTVRSASEARWSLLVRLPSWAGAVTATLNGRPVPTRVEADGYLHLRRGWSDGDELSLRLEVPVRPVWASGRVGADAGRVALTCGPFVYCVESVDVDVPLPALLVDPTSWRPGDGTAPDGAPPTLVGEGWAEERGAADERSLYFTRPAARRRVAVRAVPYHAWNNRGPGGMAVWLRDGAAPVAERSARSE